MIFKGFHKWDLVGLDGIQWEYFNCLSLSNEPLTLELIINKWLNIVSS